MEKRFFLFGNVTASLCSVKKKIAMRRVLSFSGSTLRTAFFIRNLKSCLAYTLYYLADHPDHDHIYLRRPKYVVLM